MLNLVYGVSDIETLSRIMFRQRYEAHPLRSRAKQYLQAYLSPSHMVSALLFYACILVSPLLVALYLET